MKCFCIENEGLNFGKEKLNGDHQEVIVYCSEPYCRWNVFSPGALRWACQCYVTCIRWQEEQSVPATCVTLTRPITAACATELSTQ